MSDAGECWRQWAAGVDREARPISDDRAAEMLREAWKYGPANCWTGTLGTLAGMIVELLQERVRKHDDSIRNIPEPQVTVRR